MDGRTDRRTELRWLRRAIAVPAFARKNHSSQDGEYALCKNGEKLAHTRKISACAFHHINSTTMDNRQFFIPAKIQLFLCSKQYMTHNYMTNKYLDHPSTGSCVDKGDTTVRMSEG